MDNGLRLLIKEQNMILDELYKCHLISPMAVLITKNEAIPIIPELTDYEKHLYFLLDMIKTKMDRYNGYTN